jgi:hypothetical protein
VIITDDRVVLRGGHPVLVVAGGGGGGMAALPQYSALKGHTRLVFTAKLSSRLLCGFVLYCNSTLICG